MAPLSPADGHPLLSYALMEPPMRGTTSIVTGKSLHMHANMMKVANSS